MSISQYRIVLIGKTGSGKSASGNSILDEQNVFQSRAAAKGVTQHCELKSGFNAGVMWNVVDTPGVCDLDTPENIIMEEILKCIDLTAPGPHAIIMVTKIDRFTEDDQKSFELFFRRFGSGMYKHALVLFTCKDSLIHDKITLEKYISDAGEHLNSVLEKVNHRCVAFNNREPDPEMRKQQVEELAKMIAGIARRGQISYFTDKAYKLAYEYNMRRQLELEEKKKQEALKNLIIAKDELLKHLFSSSVKARSQTVNVLREMAVEFDMCLKKDRAVSIGGSSVALVGTALTIAAGIAAIVTAGAAIPFLVGSLMWTGFGIGLAGGLISFSSQMVSAIKERELKESIISALNSDKDQNAELQLLAAATVFANKRFLVKEETRMKDILKLTEAENGQELSSLLLEILPEIEELQMPDEQLDKVFTEVKKFSFPVRQSISDGVKSVAGTGVRIGGDELVKLGVTGARAAGGMAIGLGVIFTALDGYNIYSKATQESFGDPLRKIAAVLEAKMLRRE